MCSYNTSFHTTVKASPFYLTFGMDPRLPSFPASDLKFIHYREGSVSLHLQTLQRARLIDAETLSNQDLNLKKISTRKLCQNQSCLKRTNLFYLTTQSLQAKIKSPVLNGLAQCPSLKSSLRRLWKFNFKTQKENILLILTGSNCSNN